MRMEIDTTAISDALDALGIANTCVTSLRGVSVPRRLAGRVVTVTLADAAGRTAVNHLGTSVIDAAEPGDVIVVEHRGPHDVSGWGGLLSLGAQLRGIAGVIIDGACRDADEMTELDFPVYAKQTTPVTARGRVIEVAWNAPVTIDGVSVEPGDYVVADRSGIVFVRAADRDAVLAAAHAIAEREGAMAHALRAGTSIREALRAYETMLSDGAVDA